MGLEHHIENKQEIINNSGNKTKYLVVKGSIFKESLMLMQTDKSKLIRKYYIQLEEIFQEYILYQTNYYKQLNEEKNLELKMKDLEIQSIKDETNSYKNIILNRNILILNHYIYIATSINNAKRNIFKIGMTTVIKGRLRNYQIGRCDDDTYYYLHIISCTHGKDLEQYIFAKLSNFNYIDNEGKHKKELYQIDYNVLINIFNEFEKFEKESTKVINNELVNYYNNYQNLDTINVEDYMIKDLSKYFKDKFDIEDDYINNYANEENKSNLNNEIINKKLEPFNIKLICNYTGNSSIELEFQCITIFNHKFKMSWDHMNRKINNNKDKCFLCTKKGILDQCKIYVYKDKTYDYINYYNDINELKEKNLNIDDHLLRNIIREERWLTSNNKKIYSILAPDLNNKLNLDKDLTEIELELIKILEIDYIQMKNKIKNSILNYIYAIDIEDKIIYRGNTNAEFGNKLTYKNGTKLLNRKTIGKYLKENIKKIYGGYLWKIEIEDQYKEYKLIII